MAATPPKATALHKRKRHNHHHRHYTEALQRPIQRAAGKSPFPPLRGFLLPSRFSPPSAAAQWEFSNSSRCKISAVPFWASSLSSNLRWRRRRDRFSSSRCPLFFQISQSQRGRSHSRSLQWARRISATPGASISTAAIPSSSDGVHFHESRQCSRRKWCSSSKAKSPGKERPSYRSA